MHDTEQLCNLATAISQESLNEPTFTKIVDFLCKNPV